MKQRFKDLQPEFDKIVNLGPGAFLEGKEQGRALIEQLAIAFGCDWGTLWKVDAGTHQLCPAATWNAPSTETRQLVRDTVDRRLSISEGNAGHVWRSRRPIWTVDLIRDMCIPRSLDAMHAGLRGGIWFAVKTDEVVYGVIELLGQDLPAGSSELIAVVEILGIQLGEAIDRAVNPRSAAADASAR